MTDKPSLEILTAKIKDAQKRVKIGGIYYHWKNPKQHYKTLDFGFCEWDGVLCVIYQPLGFDTSVKWIRRLEGKDGWLTPVENNGQTFPRFTLVEE